jgi:hypothetical protein
VTTPTRSGEANFCPDPEALVYGYIRKASIVESGLYIRLSLTEPNRIVTVWMSDGEMAKARGELRDQAAEFYSSKSPDEALSNALAVDLAECLDSLPRAATAIALRDDMFVAIENEADQANGTAEV